MTDESIHYISYSPILPFPDKVILRRFFVNQDSSDTEQLYFKRIYCDAIVVMQDEDNVVGNCTCSICKNSIDLFDKFCSNCGAKVKGRRIFDKDGNETD